jgi:glycosyltransferase involved in cell wall biosynthesis
LPIFDLFEGSDSDSPPWLCREGLGEGQKLAQSEPSPSPSLQSQGGEEDKTATQIASAARKNFGIPHDAFVIGTVGRVHEVKRQDLLLRAAADLKDTWVLIVGDGPELASLKNLAKSLRMDSRVIFAGYLPTPANGLCAMDVFALTSRSEGFPVSLLEAWSLGLPVVVSAVGGLPSIVNDGETGLVVPPNDWRTFAEAFRKLRRDSSLRSSLGKAGRQTFQANYTLDRMAERYDALYAAPQ